MHARIEHLLSLRDGEPVDAAVRDHVEHCPQCATRLAEAVQLPARLRALPAAESRDGGWAAVQERRVTRASQARHRARAARIAVAASVAVIAVAVAWRVSDAPVDSPRRSVAAVSPLTAEQAIAADRVAQLQTQSAALEEMLAMLGERPVVARAGTAVPIDRIEAQVQWIDHQLTLNADDTLEAEPLWRERVQAMNSLVQLRYVEAQSIAM